MNCYRFPSKEEFYALAEQENLLNEEGQLNEKGQLITASHTFAIDEIGTISKGGKYDPETGEVITPPTVMSGWHVNVVGDLAPEAWDQYLAVVNHPVRIFFGGPTQAPDTATLKAMA